MRTWTVDELLALSSGYWEVCALHAAVLTDFFGPLSEGPLDIAALADRLGCPLRSAVALGTAMCAMGLATRQGDEIAATPFALRHLVRTSPDFLGHIIEHHHHLMDGWMKLDQAVRTGLPSRGSVQGDEVTRNAFLRGMANMASRRIREVLPALDFSQRHRLLDLGGGPGSYAAAFCETWPGLSAVIFDRPGTEPVARQTLEERGLADRIGFVAGDMVTDPLPTGFDVVWLSHVLHSAGQEAAAVICRKAAAALTPGGLFLVQEFFLDDTLDGPLFPALFGLNMLSGTTVGKVFSWQETAALLEQAGFVDITRLDTGSNPSVGVLMGVLPEQA